MRYFNKNAATIANYYYSLLFSVYPTLWFELIAVNSNARRCKNTFAVFEDSTLSRIPHRNCCFVSAEWLHLSNERQY